MDVCKCIISSIRKSSREVVGMAKEVGDPDYPQGVLFRNRGGSESNRAVICMVFKATANDRRTTSPLPR
ncbi:hypothetical protein TNCV_3314181 [Trichonephila clavipes]|nr:hypothetical protein TNCV_3314181 [Trichonephila clavipes]